MDYIDVPLPNHTIRVFTSNKVAKTVEKPSFALDNDSTCFALGSVCRTCPYEDGCNVGTAVLNLRKAVRPYLEKHYPEFLL